MSLVRPLLVRLHRDLAELRDSPYPGITVFTDDANIRKFCLILSPPSGPWKDLSLHFDVELPDNWPSSPPKIRNSVSGIDHPNLFGDYICCDLLKEAHWLERGYTGGYSPALTLRGLFLQFLTFFSSTKVEQDWGGTVDIGDAFIPNYVSESYAAKGMTHLTTSHTPLGCRCAIMIPNEQARLQALWDADLSPEVVLKRNSYSHVVQKTKQAMLRPAYLGERVRRLDYRNPKWVQTRDCISEWCCSSCPYGSLALPHYAYQPGARMMNLPSSLLVPPPKCLLPLLNDDILYELAGYFSSESLLSFCSAYPRVDAVVKSAHVLLQRELRCFFLRTPLIDSVLGIGISLDWRPTILSSDFDWLSEAAFQNHDVRMSVQKRHFEFFLPLAFSPAHFNRALPRIWLRLVEIDDAIRREQVARVQRGRVVLAPTLKEETVGVIYKMMNNIVVSLMKTADDVLGNKSSATLLHASEKAVESYCHLFHLLICLCRASPLVLNQATSRIHRFLTTPSSRVKNYVPDVGELIVVMTLVLVLPPVGGGEHVSWKRHLNGPLLEEVIIRNVRWVLKEAPELQYMEQGHSAYRLAATFTHSRTSLRLVMFQIAFLKTFAQSYSADVTRLDHNYGFPDQGIPERMVQEIKEIYQVASWPAFFTRVSYDRGREFGKEKFCAMLREAMETSGQRNYHTPYRFPERLARDRAFAEQTWRNSEGGAGS